ncbi:hypothetical protein J5N97_015534 [Dioscorea zingiberensis]|uniref:DUF4283 domain-containing protein n=1 Tax=Dioscorea zingiberensis TaxID=325984 RepID=A0A9D5CUG2_9LILI|nr:hypothetical protein J5N97_015534 [Dioscorea zingiberensis]
MMRRKRQQSNALRTARVEAVSDANDVASHAHTPPAQLLYAANAYAQDTGPISVDVRSPVGGVGGWATKAPPAMQNLAMPSKPMERMKTFSIITVKERKAGSVTIQDITDVLVCLVDDHWTWTVKPLRDGRYIVAFPTAELARQTEKAGPLSVLALDLSFEPWSPDLWQSRKAEGATRWVIIRNLPMDCWGRDEAASLLKTAGDLVAMDRHSQRFGNDLRLLLRVRWPRRLPASIHCSMGVRQFNYTVELDAGQPALP